MILIQLFIKFKNFKKGDLKKLHRKDFENSSYNEIILIMKNIENDMDIYFAVGNANTLRQEKEIREILKKRNYLGWKIVSTSTAIVDMKNQFSNLYIFWEREKIS